MKLYVTYLFLSHSNIFVHHYEIDYVKLIFTRICTLLPCLELKIVLQFDSFPENKKIEFINLFSKFSIYSSIYSSMLTRHSISHLREKNSEVVFAVRTRKFIQFFRFKSYKSFKCRILLYRLLAMVWFWFLLC